MLTKLLGADAAAKLLRVLPQSAVTEVRLRLGQRVQIKDIYRVYDTEVFCDVPLINSVVANATERSRYAYFDEIKHGYIYCGEGVRLGLAGDGVVLDGRLDGIKDIRFINIRFAHDIFGVASILKIDDFENTLIISPPFCGKTTIIRDYARSLSMRYDVAVADERYELFGRTADGYSFKTGKRMDIISGVPKELCAEGLIRSMSPEIIVLDEVFPQRDLRTLEEITRAGVKLLCSFHAESAAAIKERHRDLLSLFRYAVTLSNKPHIGHINSVLRMQ